jgi:DNA-binding MarR family transcriptional regulator
VDQGLPAVDDALLRLRRLWAVSRHRILNDGLTTVELSSLLVVEICARLREQGEAAHVSDVATFADVTPSTASRLVDSAEHAGLLSRQPSRRSARHTALVLTPAGAALQQRAAAARIEWLSEQLDDWPSADVDDLGRLLQRLANQVNPGPGVVSD